jgi:hypothetical protein
MRSRVAEFRDPDLRRPQDAGFGAETGTGFGAETVRDG